MMRHLTDDELIDLFYGASDEAGHLDTCAACSARWRSLVERRQWILPVPEIPARVLAVQRARIYERLESGQSWVWGFRPPAIASALGVLVLALVLLKPSPEPQPTLAANESHFFTEVYSIVEASEPAATAPFHGLFEE